MTVKELKNAIANLPDDMEIILQKDAEGNEYSPLQGADHAIYIPETTYYGNVYELYWTEEAACMNETEWKKIKEKPRALILYPIN